MKPFDQLFLFILAHAQTSLDERDIGRYKAMSGLLRDVASLAQEHALPETQEVAITALNHMTAQADAWAEEVARTAPAPAKENTLPTATTRTLTKDKSWDVN